MRRVLGSVTVAALFVAGFVSSGVSTAGAAANPWPHTATDSPRRMVPVLQCESQTRWLVDVGHVTIS
jgi:hypothetical protein